MKPQLLALLLLASPSMAAEPAAPAETGVAAIKSRHDRALIADLLAYAKADPKADDLDQAYATLFDVTIAHDWFADQEATANAYVTDRPDGAVRGLALIVSTMARAQAADFDGALVRYQQLLEGLSGDDQEEFAVNFADNLAGSAVAAGKHGVAGRVLELVRDRFKESSTLAQKVAADLARLDRVTKPAPAFDVKDLDGKPVRSTALRGKYVLVDFWATWCEPCLEELPRLQAAYAAYHAKGLEIVGVSLDETKSTVTDFLKEQKLPWTQVHNPTCNGDLVEAFGVVNIPASYLIDPEGIITRIDLRGENLDAVLSRLIK
ncbi:TlpA disulfide reductase family protein [Isosphaeraceae bacterium EP7]